MCKFRITEVSIPHPVVNWIHLISNQSPEPSELIIHKLAGLGGNAPLSWTLTRYRADFYTIDPKLAPQGRLERPYHNVEYAELTALSLTIRVPRNWNWHRMWDPPPLGHGWKPWRSEYFALCGICKLAGWIGIAPIFQVLQTCAHLSMPSTDWKWCVVEVMLHPSDFPTCF